MHMLASRKRHCSFLTYDLFVLIGCSRDSTEAIVAISMLMALDISVESINFVPVGLSGFSSRDEC